MTTFFRKFALSLALTCLALTLSSPPAYAEESGDIPPCTTAKASVHKKHVVYAKKATKKNKAKATKGSDVIRGAQEHLAHLGYYTGKIDGIMGPQTRAATKSFQRDHGLKADGILGKKTLKALQKADKVVLASPRVKKPFQTYEPFNATPETNPDIHQDYTPSLKDGVKTMYSRFAAVNVTESSDGVGRRYTVSLNGAPLLIAGGQSSVIGVSKTYDMGDQDAIILTTYNPDSTLCSYGNYVLALNAAGTKLLEIENCTRGYEAGVNNGSLIITFPERDDNRVVGATWRLDGTNLTRL